MALFQIKNLRRFAANLIRSDRRQSRRPQRGLTDRMNRRLMVDPLEERQLLSVSPMHVDDLLVNQTASSGHDVLSAQSMAIDHDGDIVVAWTRSEELPDGQIDSNIWARYFTDEVQRLTLPQGVLEDTDGDGGTFGRFDLQFGKEVQRLTVQATYEPYMPEFFQELIAGSFQLGFDVDGNGTVGAGETTTIDPFFEGDPVADTAQSIEDALRFLGGALTDVEVHGVSPHEFTIEFPEDVGDQPLITVESINLTSGFLPSVVVDQVSEPVEFTGMPVSPTNPMLTASGIEAWFHQYQTEFQIGPIDFPPPARVPNPAEGPYFLPETMDVSVPTISVDPVSETEFDITFTGASGKQDHPELVVLDVRKDNNISIGGSPEIDVTTLKQPSPEFRVNAPQVDDPFTPQIDVYEQSAPAVAMDADGDFVITWQGVVPDSQDFGSVTDIFARRFSPIAYQENEADVVFKDADDNPIQSVRPLGSEFRVNTFTTNAQSEPSVGMDDDGNFVIAWRNEGQDLSFFNGITAQRYNRDGERLGSEFMVNTEDTYQHWEPYVGVAHDGHFAISWARTHDTRVLPPTSHLSMVMVEIYDPEGNTLVEQLPVGGAGSSSVAWDDELNFAVSWDEISDDDSLGITTTGSRATMYELYNESGELNPSPIVIRDEFRLNSATGDADSQPLWPLWQSDPHIGLDADGDLFATYDGFAPDVSETDVDQYIESFLISWSPFLNDEELAQLRWDLENESAFSPIAWGLLRGEANGVMVSRFDADPELNPGGSDIALYSDSVVNNFRDGHNTRVMIELDDFVSGGAFTLTLVHPFVTGQEVITINPVFQNEQIVDGDTADAIDAALEAATRTGVQWESPFYGGPIDVRVVPESEIIARQGTPWELPDVEAQNHVFEVTFQGEVHDTPMGLFLNNSSLTSRPVTERQVLVFDLTTEPQSGELQLLLDTDGDGALDDLGTFNFDSDNPGASAGPIAALLQAAGYDNVEVNMIQGTNPFQFEVIFNGNPGENIPVIVIRPVRDPDTDEPSLDGNFYSDTDEMRDGGNPPATPPNVFTHTYGADGTAQSFATLGVEPDGDLAMGWLQREQLSDGSLANQNIFIRQFNEDTDTAGPLVTDFLLPGGDRLAHGDEVLEPLEAIVVSFDEDMMTSGIHSVTNPENWVLLRDNVEMIGGIHSIEFGMNRGADIFGTPGSNKWEAVIWLDGNGASPGIEELQDGHYQIVALNSIRDRAGNALGRTGYEINGGRYSRTFNVLVPADSSEVPVNDLTDYDQYTQPNSPQAIADDADGDYVTVWTSDDPARPGVYAKLYNVEWFEVDGDRESLVTEMSVIDPTTGTVPMPEREIRITDDPTATNASVARDIDGDFVVTWSQWSADTDWDVYARRFDAAGNALGSPFLVNAETEDNQRYSTVALDGDGDFVVTWQSQGQDGSGYGVYAKRYDSVGNPLGGVDEVQRLNFSGQARWDFQLSDGVNSTPVIHYEGNSFNIVDTVAEYLEDYLNLEVEVEAVSFDVLLIRFVGADGSQDVPPLAIENAVPIEVEDGAQLTITTAVNGAPADFLVNQTTEQNQRFPSIAMDTDGGFVITWTSGGQDGDAPYETNVYARQFVSNDVFRANSRSATGRKLLHHSQQQAGVAPKVIAFDDPDSIIVGTGTNLDGVGMVSAGGAIGSGSLLDTGRHVLTAAHVVVDFFGAVDPADVAVTFDTASGPISLGAAEVFVHPGYTGDVTNGNDIAIIVLDQEVPAGVPRLDIYRETDELDQRAQVVGYGRYGTGDEGEQGFDGRKRAGFNEYDSLGDVFDGFAPGIMLAYDFDNGLEENDAFGTVFGIDDLGLGEDEGFAASGDSGGPIIVDGLIAGLTSFGYVTLDTPDITDFIDSSFGEFQVDTRVSSFADWIDSITAVTALGSDEFLVNQTTVGMQKQSDVAMDSDGDFVITWTSYNEDGTGNGPGAGYNGQEGVFARRYNASAETQGDQFQVNTFADGDQQFPRIAMDANGDFVIAWESFQDRPQPPFNDPGTEPDVPNSFGIFAQRYARNELVGESPFLGPNGEIGSELAINTTKDGDQRFPGVAMDDTGDFVVLWSGYGEDADGDVIDAQGIYHRRFEVVNDIAGPQVADVLNAPETPAGANAYQVRDGDLIEDANVTRFVVSFGEDLNEVSRTDFHSVENLQNWRLSLDGQIIFGAITSVDFGLNEFSDENKYQAVVEFDANPTQGGVQPLEPGVYVLTIDDNVEDIFGNALDGDYDGEPGGDYSLEFSVLVEGSDSEDTEPGDPDDDEEDDPINNLEGGNQNEPAVAGNDVGDYVVVWTSYGMSGDAPNEGNIVAQRFDVSGEKEGSEFVVNTIRAGHQGNPDVAVDDFGNFVVTWEGVGDVDDSGVFARRFDAVGTPLGDQFRVNQFRKGDQHTGRVATDRDGDFVVTFSSFSFERADDVQGVYARHFPVFGDPSNEFRVNQFTTGAQRSSDVAMDDNGNFVIVWNSDEQDASSWSVIGRMYNANLSPRTNEFRVNTYGNDKQINPVVAMDRNGDFGVAWSSFLQDGSGYGVYARRYNAAGSPVGTSAAGEFRVNQTAQDWQREPAISMDEEGQMVVTWTSFGQDNPDDEDLEDDGIFARIYDANGNDFVDDDGNVPGEFRINATTAGNQFASDVAMDADGDFVTVWVGPDSSGDGIFARRVAINDPVGAGGAGAGGGGKSKDGGSVGNNTVPGPRLLAGTVGDDVFEFTAGPDSDSWIAKVNGTVYQVGASYTGVSFDGRGGNDRVVIHGSGADESIVLYPNAGVFDGGDYRVTFNNVETVEAMAGGGHDVAEMVGSPERDAFSGSHELAEMEGRGYLNRAVGFDAVEARSGGGRREIATLHDSPHDDLFEAEGSYGKISSGDRYSLEVSGFFYTRAFATAGGDDAARLHDTAGDEFLYAEPGNVRMINSAYNNVASGFATVEAFATAGGVDQARLYDSAGDDIFVGTPETGRIYGDGYDNTAHGFELSRATASGGYDTAKFYDSAGNDVFVANHEQARMSGPNFGHVARYFEKAIGYSQQGGSDQAYLSDTAMNEFLEADGDEVTMTSEDLDLIRKAIGFDAVTAEATEGDDVKSIDASVDYLLTTGDWTDI